MKTFLTHFAFSVFCYLAILQIPFSVTAVLLERAYSRPTVDLPQYECDNLYDNAKDMVILSQYIYLHAEMVAEAEEEPSTGGFWDRNKPSPELIENRSAALKPAETVGDIISLANSRTDLFSMKKGGSNVAESAEVVTTDLSDGDDIGRTSDSLIEIVQASKEDVSRSCVYAITKHEAQKRVVVVFRGTSNSGDWIKDALITQRQSKNPVSDESNSIAPSIGIHSGFSNALLKGGHVEKILLELKQVMVENPDHKLFVTGHSLGGAMATLFGFYVAANDDPIYVKNGPVQVFSVSSPRVGNKSFRDSFKYLEERGKIRHARIYNSKDKVAMLPYIGGRYKHVGLELKLRRRTLPIRFDYPRYEGWTMSSNSVSTWEQITSTIEAVKYHGCQLVRDRLKLAKDTLKETTLDDEYKRMWGILD